MDTGIFDHLNDRIGEVIVCWEGGRGEKVVDRVC